MKKKNKFLKVMSAMLSVLCIFCVLAVVSFAEESEETEIVVSKDDLEGKYGLIIPSDKELKEPKTSFTLYGDSSPLYFIINSKGDSSSYCAVEIYSKSSRTEDSLVTNYSKSLDKKSINSLSINWNFKNIHSGKYYGKSYIYTENDGQKIIDTSTESNFTVTVKRIGKQTPELVSVKNGNGFVILSWNELTFATEYKILRKLSGDKNWTTLATVKKGTSSYKDSTVKNEKKYIYTVKAYDGSYASLYNKKGLSINYISTNPKVTKTTAVSDGLTLKWSKAQTDGKYTVIYKTDNGWKKLSSTSSTSYTDKTLPKNSNRTYRIYCIGTDGKKHYSEKITAKRLNEPSLSFYSKDGKIVLKWSKISDAEKYRIYRLEEGSWKKVGETEKNSYSVKASNGKNVMYTVRCISSDSKNVQSYYKPYSCRYTEYKFRKKNLTMAGGGSFSNSGGLTLEQQQAVFRYMNAYYSSIGSFNSTASGIFKTASLRDREKAIWDSLIAVRSRAIEDLSLSRFKYSLTVTDLKKHSANCVEFTIFEDAVQKFRDIPVLSESYKSESWFTLTRNSNGKWVVSKHDGDCSPFCNFEYDSNAKKDRQLSTKLECIKNRQSTVGVKKGKNPSCDHPYDRTKAKNYMMKWLDKRNPSYYAYDNYGGNCMNFASQVLYAGGIHKTNGWFWYDDWDYSPSWTSVSNFARYASGASKKQLYCKCDANYYSGNVCDIVLIGIDSPRNHATIISDLVLNSKGETIDYLLCCNTTNLKNFPAAAYHYTNQQLIRIYGWND